MKGKSIVEIWALIFQDRDIDSVLNEVDERIDDEEFMNREEGFIDLVDQSGRVARSEIVETAKSLIRYAEDEE